ncbi:unnamed protein product [Blumeria hordei]|uniref:DH domain-containing protein n=1 Tax=Blumeria hordei TaxID=2867405 RepID=A0A383USQ6_BLUHO|nr:unnamed protein product [Blumeria hordei]
MVRVSDELQLSPDDVTPYYTTDIYLGNLPVLVFHGPSTITNSTLNGSRIQLHIFTAAGFQSYQRLTISPSSPNFQSVTHLPREKQGSEVCRGIAFGILKYFKELSENAKSAIAFNHTDFREKRSNPASFLFTKQHAADLAGSMIKVENVTEVVQEIQAALRPQNINHIDVDLVLPQGSIKPIQDVGKEMDIDDDISNLSLKQYGEYAPLVKLFGEVTFLPTSRLRRAPSRATSINRERTFRKEQKMSLRREMGEFVDTEERYVIKMHELVHSTANEFRDHVKNRKFESLNPSEDDLARLFPKSLDRILQINTAFLNAIRKVMDQTEEDAMQDLEAPAVSSSTSRGSGSGRLKDPTGALAFARILLEWLPQFSDCYQDYIKASQSFPQIITSFLKQQSSISRRVQKTGEQQLRSAIIEPVQRLPRYSLFIDNIINFLPVSHPALQPMLKARDIIISICSLDPPEADKSQLVARLQNLVESWPTSLAPQGRLVAAVDFLESPTPHNSITTSDYYEGIFLLFTDQIVFVKKLPSCSLSARGILAEIDTPSKSAMLTNISTSGGGHRKAYEISFSSSHSLGEIRFTMSDDGRSITMILLQNVTNTKRGKECYPLAPAARVFILQGGYEGRGLKLTEEITKARIEGRFSEVERESEKWCMRSTKSTNTDINFHSAIFEDRLDTISESRGELAPIRILIDHQKENKEALIGKRGVEVIAKISTLTNGKSHRLEFCGLNEKVFVDEFTTEEFLCIFLKRIAFFLRSQHDPSNIYLTSTLVSSNIAILKSLQIQCEGEKQRSFKSGSPVKLLSSFFNGSTTSASVSKYSRNSTYGNLTSINRSNSNKSISTGPDIDNRAGTRATMNEAPENYFTRLEETFTAYVTAISSRRGNIIGRALRNRAMADELAVNAVYNTFIENPLDQRAASEATVDVLFMAFEKYLRMAWREEMGDVISIQSLDEMQMQAFRLASDDFAEYVRLILSEMTPQNRRALIAIMKLLAELLDACSNDGDRGAMTAVFSELLVVEGDPHDYINLLDRLVSDQKRLFETIGPGAIGGECNKSLRGSTYSTRNNPSATASVASNTSSFRKKFADTLLRQNSVSDRASVWRTLSKSNRSIATGEPINQGSLSKAALSRSRSIESPARRQALKDRPTVLGAFEDRPPSLLESTKISPPNNDLSAYETNVIRSTKKKRRSSLSDLKTLLSQENLGPAVNSLDTAKIYRSSGEKPHSSLRTPSPTKIPILSGPMETARSNSHRIGSPVNKNKLVSSSTHKSTGCVTEYSRNIASPLPNSTSDVVLIKDLWITPSHKKTTSTSTTNIPVLQNRPLATSVTVSRRPIDIHRSPPKLRIQSPQKLRERLQTEANAIKNAEADVHSELSKIGSELSQLHSRDAPSYQSTLLSSLQSSLSSLSVRFPSVIADLTARHEVVAVDVEQSLLALESKVEGLDRLYHEATAENELLYERFNSELSKIIKSTKGGVDIDICYGPGTTSKNEKCDRGDLIKKLRDAIEETARIKKENFRLKREVLSLRTLLKDNERIKENSH